MVLSGPVSWLVVVVFKFTSDGSVANWTKSALGESGVLVIELWQIRVLVAMQPACVIPFAAREAIFCRVQPNKITVLIREPELPNCLTGVDCVEWDTTQQ